MELKAPFRGRPGDLHFFIDETGEESLSDPRRPMFGFGGCAVRGEAYTETIAVPWRTLKRKHFGTEATLLHAAELTGLAAAQMEAIGTFFSSGQFNRFAAVVTPSTTIENVADVHDAASHALQAIIGRIVASANPGRVVLFFEDSNRGRRLIMKHFGNLCMQRRFPDGTREQVPIVQCFMPKMSAEPGLEVADFVAHTAGCQASNHDRGDRGWRKDFAAVFQAADKNLAEYAHLTELKRMRVPLEPGHEPGATYLDLGVENLGAAPDADPVGTPHMPAAEGRRD